MNHSATRVSAIALAALLCRCGLYVPQKDPLQPNDIDPQNRMSRQGKIESNIIANIRCEVTRGIYYAVATGNVPWIANWGTTISLNLVWEEQSSINPGLTYTTPFHTGSETFSLGGGLSGSAHSTRNEAITFTLENKTLLREAMLTRQAQSGLDCSALEGGATVQSDLKIDEFIYDKATIAGGHEARTRPIEYPQFSTFQETLTFVVTLGGSVTPSWKLIRLSVNPNGPFVNASRVKTSTIIITLGPLAKPATPAGPAELALQARIQHDAAFAGGSTASAILSQSR